jgi:membrane protein required for colicin V production
VNWLDIVLVVVLAFSILHSLRRGFSREVVGLAASLAALILAMWFYGLAGSYIAPYVGSLRTANLLGFLLVVVTVLVLGGVLGWIVSRFIRTIGLSFFDRLLGAGFGLVRGLLITIAILTAFMAFGPRGENISTPEAVVHSRIAPYILEASRWFVAIAPMDLKQNFRERYSQFRSGLEQYTRMRGDKDSATK